MARYTIAGMVYSDALAIRGVAVDIKTASYAEYDAARTNVLSFAAYRVVCSAQEGATMARKEFVKFAKAL